MITNYTDSSLGSKSIDQLRSKPQKRNEARRRVCNEQLHKIKLGPCPSENSGDAMCLGKPSPLFDQRGGRIFGPSCSDTR